MDEGRFERAIPRRKITNFTSAAMKTTIKQEQKTLELKGTRDLFGRLLYLSTIQRIDLKKVFSHPLIPVPLSLAHIDGSINKTDKSKLVEKIEGLI